MAHKIPSTIGKRTKMNHRVATMRLPLAYLSGFQHFKYDQGRSPSLGLLAPEPLTGNTLDQIGPYRRDEIAFLECGLNKFQDVPHFVCPACARKNY